MRARPAAILAVLWVGLACAPPARVQYEERLASATPAEEHAVHAERLVEVMRVLNRLVNERLPRSMDVRVERDRRVEEVAALAGAIAESARRIPARAEGRALGHAEQRVFAGRARVLEERAAALAEDAATLTPEAMDRRVDGLREACATCHSRFRDDIPGDAR